MSKNTLSFVNQIYKSFKTLRCNIFLMGGWAEELQGLIKPRKHKDIDFVYRGENFFDLEEWAKTNNLQEIKGKHFMHKRAYSINNILIEFTLARRNMTKFFGKYLFRWPDDTFCSKYNKKLRDMNMVSLTALIKLRSTHKSHSYTRAIQERIMI